ncbi:related to Mig2 protein [Ustilago sp. UG-2017b]|nr:related to Mig2 protein [Ustilago sp. UG-2017b]
MFPKSLLFAFVASSLFLANVGVEASTSGKFRRDNDKDKEITVTSMLSTNTKQILGRCTFSFASEHEIFQPADDSNALPIQKFITEAKKYAECNQVHPDNVQCVEKNGNKVMDKGDENWWQMAFCKRCSDAGGENRADLSCADEDYYPKFVYGIGSPKFILETYHSHVDDESKEGEKEKEAAGGKSKDERKSADIAFGDKSKHADGGLV